MVPLIERRVEKARIDVLSDGYPSIRRLFVESDGLDGSP
jgi:hypothetical protein